MLGWLCCCTHMQVQKFNQRIVYSLCHLEGIVVFFQSIKCNWIQRVISCFFRIFSFVARLSQVQVHYQYNSYSIISTNGKLKSQHKNYDYDLCGSKTNSFSTHTHPYNYYPLPTYVHVQTRLDILYICITYFTFIYFFYLKHKKNNKKIKVSLRIYRRLLKAH